MTMLTPRRMKKPIQRTRSSAGQGIVELAISMPLLLLIMLGTIDMGRMFFDYIEMRQAAIEGATYGSRKPDDIAGIEKVMTVHGMPVDSSISVAAEPGCGSMDGVGDVTVTASRVWTPVSLGVLELVSSGGNWSFTLNASSTMRCLT